jgi:hypothetical protein
MPCLYIGRNKTKKPFNPIRAGEARAARGIVAEPPKRT